MNHGSLFSGIGGFDLAAEWMGWNNSFHCEWNEFGQRVLKHYWPESITYNDITKTDFRTHRGTIDVLSGGFPCQPYSSAGKRLGKEDERHLWPEMLRAIREISPRWVVGENVLGLVNWNGGLVFEEVQADLEAEGYEVQPFILPAASVNAPHRRDRVWFVAYSSSERCYNRIDNRKERQIHNNKEWNTSESKSERSKWVDRFGEIRNNGNAPDSKGKRSRQFTQENRGRKDRRLNDNGKTSDVADTYSQLLQGRSGKTRPEETKRYTGTSLCANTWEDFPTQPPICSRNDGLSSKLDGITFPKWRNESIKAYGNAVVPQVVYQIFKAIQQYEDDTSSPQGK